MTGHIEVDYAGMDALATAGADQRRYLRAVKVFVERGCSDVGAFSGFMAIFRGDYTDALSTAQEGLETGPASARRVAHTVRANARTYHDRDIEAADGLRGLELEVRRVGLPTVGLPSPVPLAGGEPGISKGEKNLAMGTGGLIDVMNEAGKQHFPHVPQNPWDDGPKGLNPLSPIDLIGEGQSTVEIAQSGNDAGNDLDDYRDFERKHGR
ncbi:hypothetical protein [Phycicoccus sonneratiae]|uniref:Uncharacterized protein n=1 Tax=Phycicoccus sonneratiae TaxID=2807628 RepID=A0ABS2CJC3_9MICO|nr:hypothetical protein [Phycicoccus sonneraticus]MBM6399174.1 hypothetical protein [Phycicoccus sonneraticus]